MRVKSNLIRLSLLAFALPLLIAPVSSSALTSCDGSTTRQGAGTGQTFSTPPNGGSAIMYSNNGWAQPLYLSPGNIDVISFDAPYIYNVDNGSFTQLSSVTGNFQILVWEGLPSTGSLVCAANFDNYTYTSGQRGALTFTIPTFVSQGGTYTIGIIASYPASTGTPGTGIDLGGAAGSQPSAWSHYNGAWNNQSSSGFNFYVRAEADSSAPSVAAPTLNATKFVYQDVPYILSSTYADNFSYEYAEYFIDNDPGVGNGTALTVTSTTPSSGSLTGTVTFPTKGNHTLSVRGQDKAGNWSTATSSFNVKN